MRAPPDEEIRQQRLACCSASSMARTSFSPKTEPMLAPMNSKSLTATAT